MSENDISEAFDVHGSDDCIKPTNVLGLTEAETRHDKTCMGSAVKGVDLIWLVLSDQSTVMA